MITNVVCLKVTDVIKSYDYEPEPRHIKTHIVT